MQLGILLVLFSLVDFYNACNPPKDANPGVLWCCLGVLVLCQGARQILEALEPKA